MNDCTAVLETVGVAQTQAVGARLAPLLHAGDVLALIGDLGAGKTAFTQGLASGLGIAAAVTSPTFVLMNRYRDSGGQVLQHIDCYRLNDAPLEIWDAGLADLFYGDDIVVIEWADRVVGLLPEEYLEITFTYLGPERRRLCFVAHGAHLTDVIAVLDTATHSALSGQTA
jgi:tRNA threonylcarbamoyladenosine biosynthesis protein TsaE